MEDYTIAISLIVGIGIVGTLKWIFSPYQPKEIRKEIKIPKLNLEDAKQKWNKSMEKCPRTMDKYLIIGGGFLGTRIILGLLHRGEKDITILDSDPKSRWRNDKRVHYILGDIRNAETVEKACQNIETVFYTAALLRYMDHFNFQLEKSYQVNVLGAQNVVKACQDNNVKRLIYTSSSHVSLCKDKDNYSMNEESNYVTRDNAASLYGYTKALGEQILIKGHEKNHLNVFIIRACSGIFGAKDNSIIQSMLVTGEYIFLHFKMLMDWIFVDNVVYSHFLAETSMKANLHKEPQIFCVSNDEPMTDEEFRWRIKSCLPEIKMKYGAPRFVWILAFFLDVCRYIMRNWTPHFGELDYLSLSSMTLMDRNYIFSIQKIKETLGYRPVFNVNEGIQLSILEQYKGESIFE